MIMRGQRGGFGGGYDSWGETDAEGDRECDNGSGSLTEIETGVDTCKQQQKRRWRDPKGFQVLG